MSGAGSPAHVPCSPVSSHVLGSPFISETCYFLSFPPTLTPVSLFLFFLVSRGSAVALEGRGRCLPGPGCAPWPCLSIPTAGPCAQVALGILICGHLGSCYFHRLRGTSVICMKTSVMATTSSPCWKSSQETAWYVCLSLSSFLPSLGPSPLTHSVSSSVSHLLQPPPTPSAPSWPRHWHYSLRPGLLVAMTPAVLRI